jgi:hypothetical protein
VSACRFFPSDILPRHPDIFVYPGKSGCPRATPAILPPFQRGQECPVRHPDANTSELARCKNFPSVSRQIRVRITHWGTRDATGSISTQPMSTYRQEASTACASHPSLFAGASRSAGHDRRHHDLVGVRAGDQAMAASGTHRSSGTSRARVSREARDRRRQDFFQGRHTETDTTS